MPRLAVLLGPALVAAWALAGCATTRAISPDELHAWVGRPATAIEKAWGPATREVHDNGQRLLIYEQLERRDPIDVGRSDAVRHSTSQINAQANATVSPGSVYARSYLFWVDAAGAIVRAETREP